MFIIGRYKLFIMNFASGFFIIKKGLSCNSKFVVYIIECKKCKEVYIGSMQALNIRISLHKSNIKIPENRKLNVSKQLYECSHGEFKTLHLYQTKYNISTIHTHTHTHAHKHTKRPRVKQKIYHIIYQRIIWEMCPQGRPGEIL